MKHLFVPYQLAKLAKEKGFNEQCFMWYKLIHKVDYLYWAKESYFGGDTVTNRDLIVNDAQIAAPLYQQLVDWFRERHDIDVVYNPLVGHEVWHYGITSKNELHFLAKEKTDSSNYYEALTAALTKAFELI